MNIIQTRLFKPPVQDGYLIRSGLLDKLIKNQYKPVTLVVAPAGYGKSVAVSQWLDKTKTNYSWISLDKDCNELKEFLKLLCASILPFLNKKDDLCEILAEAPELPELHSISRRIVNSMASIQNEHILVLDDYHLIDNPDIHYLMQILAGNIRENHIITFISRFDPPLNWNKLRSYDLVMEIKIKDLQFTEEEISDLSSGVFSNPLNKEISTIICKSTEGWIVPTRLILKNIAVNNLDPETLKDKAVDKLEQMHVFLEVTLNQADKEVQEGLMMASLFRRFSISLLSEIFIQENPEKKQEAELLENKIKKFISQSLFIISLDNHMIWYRFHHLVKDFLNSRITNSFSPQRINNALLTGSEFFEKLQSFEEAIQLCIKAANIPSAIAIIERNRLKLLNQQQFDVLEDWLNLLPAGVIEDYPLLLTTEAIVFERKGNFDKMLQDLERAKTLMPQLNEQEEYSRAQWGEYYSIKSSTDFLMGNINIALSSSEKAMQLLDHKSSFLYYYTMAYRVFALNYLGRSTEAFDLLIQDKNKQGLNHKSTPIENHLIHTMHLMLNGKFNHYEYEAKLALDIALEKSYKAIFVMASYYLALSSYLRNDLEEALVYANKAIDIKFSARPFWSLLCYKIKATSLLAQQEMKEFRRCKIEMAEFVQNFNVPYYKNQLAIVQAELALLEGDEQKSLKIYDSVNFRLKDFFHIYFKPYLTEVKLLIAKDNNQSIEQAEILIKKYKESAHATYNQILILQVDSLHILLLIKQNQIEKALELLRELLAATKEDGLIRLYTDCGYDMKKLFDQLSTLEKNDAYTSQILKSFSSVAPEHNEISSAIPVKLPLNNRGSHQIKVTLREVKLLHLLNEELHNKEIATLLNINTDSVKKSLYRLYKKLNVNKRADAIKRAIVLDLIQNNSKQK